MLIFFLDSNITKAQEINCNSPNLLIVLDYSGSMNQDNKWNQVVEALNNVTVIFDQNVQFGLSYFPTDGDCGVDSNFLWSPVLPESGIEIRANLQGRYPAGATPLALAIDRATEYYNQLNDYGRDNLIVLISDGGETCGGNPINSCLRAFGDGYPTYVIGYSNTSDQIMLNNMAQAGGTRNAYQANDSAQLFEALQSIITEVTLIQELCDNLDNDCDGRIDEDIVPIPCDTNCGIGEKICVSGGLLSECQGGQIPPENCDNQDNDCDGRIDEIEPIPCEINGQFGQLECLDGRLSDCIPDEINMPIEVEICDGQDDDMDQRIDEFCMGGTPITQQPICPLESIRVEVCNGLDEDCDGQIDESLLAPLSVNQAGVCAGMRMTCLGSSGWAETSSSQIVQYEAQEHTCDGLDNDCDGRVDEAESCLPFQAGFQKGEVEAEEAISQEGGCQILHSHPLVQHIFGFILICLICLKQRYLNVSNKIHPFRSL